MKKISEMNALLLNNKFQIIAVFILTFRLDGPAAHDVVEKRSTYERCVFHGYHFVGKCTASSDYVFSPSKPDVRINLLHFLVKKILVLFKSEIGVRSHLRTDVAADNSWHFC